MTALIIKRIVFSAAMLIMLAIGLSASMTPASAVSNSHANGAGVESLLSKALGGGSTIYAATRGAPVFGCGHTNYRYYDYNGVYRSVHYVGYSNSGGRHRHFYSTYHYGYFNGRYTWIHDGDPSVLCN